MEKAAKEITPAEEILITTAYVITVEPEDTYKRSCKA